VQRAALSRVMAGASSGRQSQPDGTAPLSRCYREAMSPERALGIAVLVLVVLFLAHLLGLHL